MPCNEVDEGIAQVTKFLLPQRGGRGQFDRRGVLSEWCDAHISCSFLARKRFLCSAEPTNVACDASLTIRGEAHLVPGVSFVQGNVGNTPTDRAVEEVTVAAKRLYSWLVLFPFLLFSLTRSRARLFIPALAM